MGYGDELLATGMARGASALGKRIAFGDGKEIKWHHYSKEIRGSKDAKRGMDKMEPQAVQHPEELDTFVKCVCALSHRRSYLEIGAKFGGTFWAMARALDPGARMVAVDLPGATKAWPQSKLSLESAVADLRARGFDASIIWGDSTHPEIVEAVRALGPYDVMLIDANHTLPYLQIDWHNYHSLGRVIAFHDISWSRPLEGWPKGHPRIDVPEFWNELKQRYRHMEIKCDPSGRDNGIGMLWL